MPRDVIETGFELADECRDGGAEARQENPDAARRCRALGPQVERLPE
jgi:hypothetical protein